MKLFITILFNLTSNFLIACSCVNGTTTFCEYFDSDMSVVKVKIIKHHKFEDQSLYSDDITEILVTKWYSKKLSSDTLYFQNGNSGQCIESLLTYSIGTELILKTYLDSTRFELFELEEVVPVFEDAIEYRKFLTKLNDKIVVTYHICDYFELHLEEDVVIGDITKNTYYKRYKRSQLLEKLSPRLSQKYAQKKIHNKDLRQRMSIRRVERLLKRKLRKWRTKNDLNLF